MKQINRYLALILAFVLPVLFVGAHPSQRFAGQDGEDNPTRKKILGDLTNALSVAMDNYAGQLNQESYEKLYQSSIIGMLHTLDPHSSYFTAKEWESFQNDQRSRYSGIGSSINQRNGKTYIISPFNGTPAFKAGFRYGDQIVEVNGESTENMSSNQVSSKLIGPEGTGVTVKVLRAGVAEPLKFSIVRGAVPLPSITNYSVMPNGVGYINLFRGFFTTTYEEMQSVIFELKQQGMTSLVLDLRGNRGGLVDQAYRVSNLFLYQDRKIVSMRGRNPNIFPPRDLTARNTSPEDYPLVVL